MEPRLANAPQAPHSSPEHPSRALFRAAAQIRTRSKPHDHKPGDGTEVGGGPRFGRSGSVVGGWCSGLEGLRAPAPTAFQKNRTPAVPSPSPAPPSSLPAPLAEGRGSGPPHPESPLPKPGEADDGTTDGAEGTSVNGSDDEPPDTPGSGAAVIRVRGAAAVADSGADADAGAGSGESAGSCSELVARMGLGLATAKGWKPWPGSRWAPLSGRGRNPWFDKR